MSFDIDQFMSHSAKLETDGIDFNVFRTEPLDEATLRCLRYMHDVEFHTICYLRDLLVTKAHADPEITGFLTFWTYEEYFHGEAIGAVLDAHDEASNRVRIEASRISLGWKDRLAPLGTMVASSLMKDFVALHMTWGAINEWTTQAAYARLSAKAQNPTLTELMKRIMKQEGRHIDFYSTQAKMRLERSATARRVVRFALDKKWRPVGSSVMPAAEVAFLSSHLFSGAEGAAMATRLDSRIHRLPGLDNLNLITKAVAPHVSMDTAPETEASAVA